MNDILVERHRSQPLTEQTLRAVQAEAGGCMAIHRITWCGSLLSVDGLDLLCHFRGPDAESMRIATRQLGFAPALAWPCQVRDEPGIEAADLAGVTVVVSHRFDTPAAFGAQAVMEESDKACFERHRVRLVRSYLSLDRRRMDCLCQAPDVVSVRLAHRQAGVSPGQVRAVRRYAP